MQPEKNVIYDRFQFYRREQSEGESFDAFLRDIKMLVKPCEFNDQQDNMLRDKIVLGISNREVQERLLRTSNLTLAKAVDICRSVEISKMQVRGQQIT